MRHISSLPFDLWPNLDRELWSTTVASTEEWLDQARAAGWTRRTRDEAMNSYGRWLRWLKDHDRLDPGTPPTHRVVPELVRRFIADELIRIRATTLSTILFHLAGIVTSFAPGEDWAWLYVLRSRLKRKASREPRTRPRIVPAQNLFDLGLELMRRATKGSFDDDIDIDLFLDGLLLALLISVYSRIANFTQLELGRNLERGPDQWRLQIAGDLTKTRQADNSLLPVTLTQWIDLYVNLVRPRLTVRCHEPTDLSRRFWIGLMADHFRATESASASRHALRRRSGSRSALILFARLQRQHSY